MEDKITKVRSAMESYFGDDRRRIDHAGRVTAYAEQLLEKEPGDRELVLVAALLHDIGIPEAERKYGSCAGNLQELEGPPVARGILEDLGYADPFITEVCTIIASHHSPGEMDSKNFRLIWDADWLVNLRDELDTNDTGKLEKLIERIFMTSNAKELARQIYLP